MNVNTIYVFGFALFATGMAAMNAQAQHNEKNYYRMERVKANNPWTTSMNGAGLIFNNNQDFSVITLDLEHGKGSLRNVNEPESFNKTNATIESYQRLANVSFYGKFGFEYMNRLKMGWCNVIDPYRSPIFYADSVPGKHKRETYNLEGGVGFAISNHWGIGAKIDYTVIGNAKQKDARNKNTYMDLNVYPGAVYRTDHVNAGMNFIYKRETENIEIRAFGTGRTPELLTVEGLWFYTMVQVSENSSIIRDIEDNCYGGAVQLEFLWGKGRFFNEFSMLEKRQEIFRGNYNKERGGEMKQRIYDYSGALQLRGDKFSHYINLAASASEMLGYDNIQQAEVVNQNSTWTQYGKKNKSFIGSTTVDINYHLFRDRSAYNSSWDAKLGAKGFYTERTYRLYPAKYEQTLKIIEGYLSFNKNIPMKNGMLDCGINTSYTAGGGTMIDIKAESDAGLPNMDKILQKEELLEQEYEFITSDRLSGGLNIRYTRFLNKDKGVCLYANGIVSCIKSTSGMFDGKKRTTLQAVIGFSF